MKRTLALSAAFGLALLSGCAEALRPAGGDEGGPAIRTDRAEYAVSRTAQSLETTIRFEYTNRTGAAVYLPNCQGIHPVALEKQVGGEWVTAFVPAIPLCVSPPVVVRPGETFPYTLRVSAGLPGSHVSPKLGVDDPEGTYRLAGVVLRTWEPDGGNPELGDPLPRELRVSNEFTLREADGPDGAPE